MKGNCGLPRASWLVSDSQDLTAGQVFLTASLKLEETMEEEKDILSLSQGWVVHLLHIASMLKACVRGTKLGTQVEKARGFLPPRSRWRGEACSSVSVHLGLPWSGDSGKPRAKERSPLRAPDHLWSDFLLFFQRLHLKPRVK